MPKVYAFDVDDTLQISRGPVSIQSMIDLRCAGHIVGICGNFHKFCQMDGWQHVASFLGQGYMTKQDFLIMLQQNIPAEEYIMVGNVYGVDNGLGFIPESRCSDAARIAGWRFIKEIDFANGAR